MGIFALLRRALLGAILLLAVTSPALAEIGCIADTSIHAQLEGPQAFADDEAGITTGPPHREPVGHSSACHLSHASHSQLPASERVAGATVNLRAPALYWVAAAGLIDGRDPDGMIRPPRA